MLFAALHACMDSREQEELRESLRERESNMALRKLAVRHVVDRGMGERGPGTCRAAAWTGSARGCRGTGRAASPPSRYRPR